MNKLIVKDIEITVTEKGAIWKNNKTNESIFIQESEIIPIVNATAELYEAVLKSQE